MLLVLMARWNVGSHWVGTLQFLQTWKSEFRAGDRLGKAEEGLGILQWGEPDRGNEERMTSIGKLSIVVRQLAAARSAGMTACNRTLATINSQLSRIMGREEKGKSSGEGMTQIKQNCK